MKSQKARAGIADNDAPLSVGFLTIAPSPYIQDMFEALAVDGRINARIFCQESLSPAFDWKPVELPDNWELLDSHTIQFMGARLFVSRQALSRISRFDYDVFVVGGYASLTSQSLMRWLSRNRIPWVFWGEIPGFQKRGVIGRMLRRIAMRPVLKRCHGIAAVGSRAATFYQTATRGRCPVVSIPYFADVSPFVSAADRRPRGAANGSVRLLFCGQLVERKGVRPLVSAVVEILRERPDSVRLDLLGRGELEDELRSMTPDDQKRSIVFHGFQQTDDLPAYFAAADVFVLPSLHDGWGVVVNQALAAGLPVISTTAVGAAADLVSDGVNGRIVIPNDTESLKRAILEIVDNSDRRMAWSAAARTIIERWSPEVEADRWYTLLTSVLRETIRCAS